MRDEGLSLLLEGSDREVDPQLKDEIRKVLEIDDPLESANVIKNCLDMATAYALCGGFVLRIMDLIWIACATGKMEFSQEEERQVRLNWSPPEKCNLPKPWGEYECHTKK